MRALLTIIALLITLFSSTIFAFGERSFACDFFREHPVWLWDAEHAQQKWGVPVSVQLAIMRTESSFYGAAMPAPRAHFMGIPLFRPSTAKGYAQALDATWYHYCRANGKLSADRASFADATDFIGWYIDSLHRELGISKKNAYEIYLAYHEGPGGYRAHSYRYKPWLMLLAKRVALHATIYHQQLARCSAQLSPRAWWQF